MPSFLMRPTAQWSFFVSSTIDFVAPGVFSKTTAGLTKRSGLVQAPSNGGSGCWSSKQEGKHGWMISTNFPDVFFFPTEIHILDAFQGRHGFVCEICFLFSWSILNDSGLYFVGYFPYAGVSWDMQHPHGPWVYYIAHMRKVLYLKVKNCNAGLRFLEKINTSNSRPFFCFCWLLPIPMLMIFMWGTEH